MKFMETQAVALSLRVYLKSNLPSAFLMAVQLDKIRCHCSKDPDECF